MVFSSLVFMFAYLPLTLLIYYIVPRKGRNIFLFFINLLFYGWGEPKLIVLMLINIAVNYIGGYLVDKFKDDTKKRKLVLILPCIIDIGTLAVFKYTGMIVETVPESADSADFFADRYQLLYIPDNELCN